MGEDRRILTSMRGPAALALVAVAVLHLAGVGLSAQSTQKPRQQNVVTPAIEAEMRQALDAYANGDDQAAQTWIKGLKFREPVSALPDVVAKRGAWSRSDAAFLLEAALAGNFDQRTVAVLTRGAAMVMKRPSPVGADSDEDRFEILWHQTAVAIAQASPWPFAMQDYLDAIVNRFEPAERAGGALATRLPLARAISAGRLCCFKRLPGEALQVIPALSRGVTLDKAMALYETAAVVPALRREALIRGAKLLYDSARFADALAWLDRVSGEPDSGLEYVHRLTRGRVLDALNRPGDAAEAYRMALTIVPDGQLAAIGRAAALLRQGRGEQAEAVASAALAMPAGRRDFDRLRAFNMADARFVPGWIAEIRRLRR